MNITDKALGIILNSGIKDQRQMFTLFREEWCLSEYQKNIYSALKELYMIGSSMDLLTVSQQLRKQNLLSKETLVNLSGMTSIGNEILNVMSIYNECQYEYMIRQLHVVTDNIKQELIRDNPHPDRITQLLSKGTGIMTDNLVKDNETISQVVTRIIENHDKAKSGIPIGIELGWISTRGKIVLEETDVMVVGGRPAMGKTAWLVSAIKKLVFDQEKEIVVFSLEMSKDQIIRRLIAQLCDIDSNSIKLGQCTYEEIQRIFSISGSPLFERLHLYDGSHTILEIAQKTSEIKNSRNVDLVMIDYLQKVTPEKSGERYQEVTRISNGIKKMTMTMRIPTIALAQLSRDSGKTGRRPTLPDLKESGEIEQDASIVAFLHRPEYYGDLYDDIGNSNAGRGEFIIAKNRDGSNGIIDMSVDLSRSAWSEFKGYPDDYVRPETNNPF